MKNLRNRVAAVSLWFVVAGASAATFTVTNTNDSGAGSLRDAITLANASAPPNTVNFDPAVTGAILLTTGQIKIGAAMSIVGPGASKLTIDGNANGRIFSIFVTSPTCPAVDNAGVDFLVSISGLRLTNALRGTTALGGAIYAEHSLALDSIIVANSVAASGAGLGFAIQYPGQTLTITNTQFLNNVARPVSVLPIRTHWGGGLYAGERCGALPVTAPVTVNISNSLVSSNRVQPVGLQGLGGGIAFWSRADVTISDSRIIDNQVVVPNPPIAGNGYRGGGLSGTAKSVTISRSEIAGNLIFDASANSSTGALGGGFYVYNDAETLQAPESTLLLSIVNSTVSGNASSAIGGSGSVYGNVAVDLENSTFANNVAARVSGISAASGTTYPNGASDTAIPTMKVVSSILANRAGSPDYSSTLAFTIDATNSLIQLNCLNCIVRGSGNLLDADPMLGPLAFNGGPTRSHALLVGSPAINTGSNSLKLTTDQRGPGFAREASGTVDMGATQFNGLLPGRLSVAVTGNGAGTIASNPGGISCPSTSCTADFDPTGSVTLTAAPASGSTFNGWSGACTGSGTCVVSTNSAKSVTATFKQIPFVTTTLGVSAGVITAPVATVTNKLTFNSADVGKTGAVFITAVVPSSFFASFPSTLGAAKAMAASPLAAATTTSSLVLIQLTASGWKPVVNGQLIPYATGVLGEQLSAQTILANTKTSTLAGAQFCVGYGTSASEMSDAGRMQLVATVPDSSAQSASRLSCLVTDSLQVQTGWNLLGNSRSQSAQVSSLYSDSSWVTAVWKWDAALKRWQFYAPSMDADALQSLINQKGYGPLSEIKAGEGYWVQAAAPASVTVPQGAAFDLTSTNLVVGWNLVTSGTSKTPSAFTSALGGIKSLWAWDSAVSNWYFYAPSLDTGTALADYIKGQGYLDFSSSNKTLDSGVGFWVNKP